MTPRRLASGALLLLVLGALGVQQWAAQAHWVEHLSGAQVAAAPAGGTGEPSPVHDCLWCQIASHVAGAAPPSVALRLPARLDQTLPAPAVTSAAVVSSTSAWSWYSRGPPAA